MLVNRVSSLANSRIFFRGYYPEIDDNGKVCYRFNYPYDYETKQAYVEFYPVSKSDANYSGYKVQENNKIARVKLNEDGALVDLDNLGINKNDVFAYRIAIDGELPFADTGIKVENNKYTLVSRRTPSPTVQGPMYFSVIDSFRPIEKKNTNGSNNQNLEAKKQQIRTLTNKSGGTISSLEDGLTELKDFGIKILATTPIATGDNVSSARYWTKNNKQIPIDLGSLEDFESLSKALFRNGMKYVFDAAFTSEGLEGIHLQQALKWYGQNPQSYYQFMMHGIHDSQIGFGVIPKNHENLRHRVINSPYRYNSDKNKIENNPEYNPKKETYFQIYDQSLISEEQRKNTDSLIEKYDKEPENELTINSHNDTIVNYKWVIIPKEYKNRLEALIEYNKSAQEKISLNSPEGTIFIGQFSNFKITPKTEGGMVLWDANADMVKRNHEVSPYTENYLRSYPENLRIYERKQFEIGAYENKDMDLQAIKYWTQVYKDAQLMYIAKSLKNVSSAADIDKLIKNGILPKEAKLSQDAFENISDGFYELDPFENLSKNDTTIKALMKFELDTLEVDETTVGVLATSFFSNLATTKDTLGKTRFELYKMNNPHLLKKYEDNYEKVNKLFTNELKDFTDKIILKINEKSTEKLLDNNGNYTEYGKYIINLVAPKIVKYALLKALVGKDLKPIQKEDGVITYDYKQIKEQTSLKALDINPISPEEEAALLRQVIEQGLKQIVNNTNDIDYLATTLQKQVEGTNLLNFDLATAIYNKAGLGMDIRLDACKDVIDIDSVRNGLMNFDEAWDKVIDYWKPMVAAVKEINPNINIISEMTDIDILMRASNGENTNVYEWNPLSKYKNVHDAMTQFYLQTGITSEAGYSYFFSDLINAFSKDFENGTVRNGDFMSRLEELIATRSVDCIRNMMTFVDNHDKPRVLHGLALDLGLFYANYKDNEKFRTTALEILMNVDDISTLPENVKNLVNTPDYFQTVSSRAVAMSKLIRDSIDSSLKDVATPEQIRQLREALVDLTNGNYLGENNPNAFTIDKIQYNEDSKFTMRKNGYAARDFETALAMLINQAEYKNDGKKYNNSDVILAKLFETMTAPAIEKFTVMMSFLAALPGLPMIYSGDELGMTGWDEKAKNIYLQNRNARVVTELEEGIFKNIRTNVYNKLKEAFNIRTGNMANAFNKGTPYLLDYKSTGMKNISAYMSQSANGETVICTFDTNGIDKSNNKTGVVDISTTILPILLGSLISLPLMQKFINMLKPNNTPFVITKWKNLLSLTMHNSDFISKTGLTVLKKASEKLK